MADFEKVIAIVTEFKEKNGDLTAKQAREFEKFSGILSKIGDISERVATLREKGDERSIASAKKLEAQLKTLNKQAAGLGEGLVEGIAKASGPIGQLEAKLERLKKARDQATDGKQIKALNGFIKDVEKQLDRAKTSTDGLGGAFQKLGELKSGLAPIAGTIAAIFGPTGALAVGAANTVKLVDRISQATGVSRDFATVATAAIQQVGGDATDLVDAFLQVSQKQNEIAAGSKTARDVFKSIGIEALDAAKNVKPVQQIFRELDQLARGGLGQSQLAALSQLLGEDSAKKILPFLGNLEEIEKQVDAVGLKIDDRLVEASRRLTKNINEATLAAKGLGLVAGAELAPSFNDIIEFAKSAKDDLFGDEGVRALFDALIGGANAFVSGTGKLLIGSLAGITKLLGGVAFAIKEYKELIFGASEANEDSVGATEAANKATEQGVDIRKRAADALAVFSAELEKTIAKQRALANLETSLANLKIKAQEEAAKLGRNNEEEVAKEITRIRRQLAEDNVKRSQTELNMVQDFANKQTAVLRAQYQKELADIQQREDTYKITTQTARDERLAAEVRFAEALAIVDNKVKETQAKNLDAINAKVDNNIKEREEFNARILAGTAKTIATISQLESDRVIEQQALLKKGEINEQEFQNRRTELAQSSALLILMAEQEALKKIEAATGRTSAETVAQRKKVSDLRIQFATQERDKEIALLEQFLALRQSLFSRAEAERAATEADLRQQQLEGTRTQFDIEMRLLRDRRQSLEEQRTLVNQQIDAAIAQKKPEAEINELLARRQQLQTALTQNRREQVNLTNQQLDGLQAENERVEALGARVNSLTGALDTTAGKIVKIAEGFKFTGENIEEARKFINDLREDATTVAVLIKGLFPGRLEFAQSFRDAADALSEAVRKAEAVKSQAAADAARAIFEQTQRELTASLSSLVADLQQELASAREEFEQAKAAIREKEKDAAKVLAQDLIDIRDDAEMDIDKILEDARKRRERQDIEDKARRLDREEDLLDEFARLRNKAESDASKERLSNLETIAELEAELSANQLESSKALTAEDRARALENEKAIQAKLAAARAEQQSDIAREKQKQSEIAKARAAAEGKRKTAKSAEELELIEEQLKNEIGRIEQRFDLLEKEEEQIKKFKGKVSEETLAAIRAEYAEQQRLLNERVDNEQAILKREAEQAAAARAAQRAAEEAATKEQIAQREKDAADELARRQTEFDEQIKQLRSELAEEKEAFKTQRAEILADSEKQLRALAAQFGIPQAAADAFLKNLLAGLGSVNSEIAKLAAQIGQLPTAPPAGPAPAPPPTAPVINGPANPPTAPGSNGPILGSPTSRQATPGAGNNNGAPAIPPSSQPASTPAGGLSPASQDASAASAGGQGGAKKVPVEGGDPDSKAKAVSALQLHYSQFEKFRVLGPDDQGRSAAGYRLGAIDYLDKLASKKMVNSEGSAAILGFFALKKGSASQEDLANFAAVLERFITDPPAEKGGGKGDAKDADEVGDISAIPVDAPGGTGGLPGGKDPKAEREAFAKKLIEAYKKFKAAFKGKTPPSSSELRGLLGDAFKAGIITNEEGTRIFTDLIASPVSEKKFAQGVSDILGVSVAAATTDSGGDKQPTGGPPSSDSRSAVPGSDPSSPESPGPGSGTEDSGDSSIPDLNNLGNESRGAVPGSDAGAGDSDDQVGGDDSGSSDNTGVAGGGQVVNILPGAQIIIQGGNKLIDPSKAKEAGQKTEELVTEAIILHNENVKKQQNARLSTRTRL